MLSIAVVLGRQAVWLAGLALALATLSWAGYRLQTRRLCSVRKRQQQCRTECAMALGIAAALTLLGAALAT